MSKLTKDEWLTEGMGLFGKDGMKWKFKCPCCGFVASTQDYKNAGAPSSAVPISCIGRWSPIYKQAFDDKDKRNIPCNYSGGGLIDINPVVVDGRKVFDFAVWRNGDFI